MKQKLECGKCGHMIAYVPNPMITCPSCSRTFDNYYYNPGKAQAAIFMKALGVIGVLLACACVWFVIKNLPSLDSDSRPLAERIDSGEQTFKSLFGATRPIFSEYNGGELQLEFPVIVKEKSASATRLLIERDCVRLLKDVHALSGLNQIEIKGMRSESGSDPENVFMVKYDREGLDRMDFGFHKDFEIMLMASDSWWHSDFDK